MNKIVCTIESMILNRRMKVTILMPPVMQRNFWGKEITLEQEHRFRVLYLLHGVFQDGEAWLSGSKIEEYVKDYNVLVVMPDMDNSFYTDMKQGQRYFTYLSTELPRFIEYTFPVSMKPEDTFVAGVSMGGFGAVKWMLHQPERFGAIGVLSGAVDLTVRFCKARLNQVNLEQIFGNENELKQSEHDLLWLMEQRVREGKRIPRIYHCCGTKDFIGDMNQNFHKKIEELEINGIFEEGEGSHNWEFWDPYVKHMVDWMFLASNKPNV